MNEQQKQQMKNTYAWNGVSFDPEKRMERFLLDFESIEAVINEKCQEYGVDSQKMHDKHFKLSMEYLYSQSRCLSWAITGPARFPVSRQEKRHRSCEDKLNRLVYFENNIEKYLKRITRKNETQDDKKAKWIKEIEQLKKYQEMMKDVNSLVRKGKIKEAEDKYNITLTPDCFGIVGFASYKLSNNLANIKRLERQVQTIDDCRENVEQGFEFDCGRVEYDSEEIRYNIFFTNIPEADMRDKLKHNGFKWSPKRKAWTRSAKTMSLARIKNILDNE